jgi:hypothetical protein
MGHGARVYKCEGDEFATLNQQDGSKTANFIQKGYTDGVKHLLPIM